MMCEQTQTTANEAKNLKQFRAE